MPQPSQSQPSRGSWAAPGDVNAFFGLMLDNFANLLLTVGLLAVVFEFPTSFAIQHMIPGTAIGVLVGDLLFFWMALSMGRRKGRYDVTAMPLGLDTPSTFGMVFFVLGPAFLYAKQTLPSVDEAALFGNGLHAVVEDAARAIPEVTALLHARGFAPRRIERIRPSLEDVFVSLIEETDRAAANGGAQ